MGKAITKGINFFSKMNIIAALAILAMLALVSLSYVSSAMADNVPAPEGVTWVLKSYGDPDNLTPAVPDAETTLTFNKDNHEVGGSGGVNGYGGNYVIDGGGLTITGVIRTLMYGPEPVQTQENAFLKILESAKSFKIDGNQLTITGTEGTLVFIQK